MPLHPQARAYIDRVSPPGAPGFEALPVPLPTLRELIRTAIVQETSALAPIALGRVESITLDGAEMPIRARVYAPESSAPLPALVYFHGGGFVLCDLDTHDRTCRALARDAGCVVVSVDYRLAPEHRFPAAAEDAYAATCAVVRDAARLGADASRVAVGGDSAGGNLATVVARMARDRNGPRLVHQLLVYPATDARMGWPSMQENGEGYFLTRALMDFFWNHYAPSEAARLHPNASPLLAEDLSRLPPATVLTAEFDPLRDEGEAYARRLQDEGVAVQAIRYDGMIHGFFGNMHFFDDAQRAMDDATAALRASFG